MSLLFRIIVKDV